MQGLGIPSAGFKNQGISHISFMEVQTSVMFLCYQPSTFLTAINSAILSWSYSYRLPDNLSINFLGLLFFLCRSSCWAIAGIRKANQACRSRGTYGRPRTFLPWSHGRTYLGNGRRSFICGEGTRSCECPFISLLFSLKLLYLIHLA